MTGAATLDDGLHCIDLLFQARPGVIAAYLLEDAGERALIEIGPTSTLDTLLRGLDNLGVDPASILKILVTHVHLDHAGAAGTFIRRFPRAQLYVHEVGAPHMMAPERLLRSAERIYGEQMKSLWGAFEAVSEANIHVLVDGSVVKVGDASLTALYTPGHARHHVAFHEPERGALFTGDVAAVRMQGQTYVRPPAPPPDLDLTEWRESIGVIRAVSPRVLYLTHFGAFTDVEAHLGQIPGRLDAWRDLLLSAMNAGHDRAHLIDDLRSHGDREIAEATGSTDSQVLERYELAAPYFMSVDGYLRYFKRLERETRGAG